MHQPLARPLAALVVGPVVAAHGDREEVQAGVDAVAEELRALDVGEGEHAAEEHRQLAVFAEEVEVEVVDADEGQGEVVGRVVGDAEGERPGPRWSSSPATTRSPSFFTR